MDKLHDLGIKIYLLKEEVKILRELLNKNNIEIPSNFQENYNRTIRSIGSIIRRVCRKCRKNLTLGYFSNIERRKDATNSICCNCVKKEFKIF
jgi:hypothetical protein